MGDRRRGFALVLVLISVAGLFALATQGAILTRSATVETRIVLERSNGLRDARAAAALVLRGLITTPDQVGGEGSGGTSGLDAPGDDAEDEEPDVELPPFLKELFDSMGVDLEEEARRATEGRGGTMGGLADGGGVTGQASGGFELLERVALPVAGVEVRLGHTDTVFTVRLSDASGGLPVNHVDEPWLLRYLQNTGVGYERSLAIAHQWLDWIDEDEFVRPRGAEDAEHLARGVACANRPMRAIEELLYLPAMTPEIFRRIRDDLSIGGDRRIHAGSASREVLASIENVSYELADQIIASRRAGPIDNEMLEDLIPIHARNARDTLRASPGPVVRIEVEALTADRATRTRFGGLAILSTERVRALGLKPL